MFVWPALTEDITELLALSDSELGRMTKLWSIFKTIEEQEGVSHLVLMGVASRETGCRNIVGDNGHGHGIMQIDDRYHRDFTDSDLAMNPLDNIRYAAKLLTSNYEALENKFPLWRGPDVWDNRWLLRGALVAYNSGLSNVQTKAKIDIGTTGNNYSYDICTRILYLKTIFQK